MYKYSILICCHYFLLDRVVEYSDEDEEAEFSSGEFNDEANELAITSYDTKRDYNPSKHDVRKYRKLQRTEIEDVALGHHHHHHLHHPSGHPVVDSDSEFEMKVKGSSRAKISRVSCISISFHKTDLLLYN